MEKVIIGLLAGAGGAVVSEVCGMIRRRWDNRLPHDRFIAARYEACDRMRKLVARISLMVPTIAGQLDAESLNSDLRDEYDDLLDEFYTAMVDDGVYFNKKTSRALRDFHLECLIISIWQRNPTSGYGLLVSNEGVDKSASRIFGLSELLKEMFGADMKSKT